MWFFKSKDTAKKDTVKDAFPKPPARTLEDVFAYALFDDVRKTLNEGNMRPVTVAEYADWLQAYLEGGGKVTQHYDHDMRDILVVRRNVDIPEFFGSKSLQVIVPSDVTVRTPSGVGHNEFYYYDDMQKNTNEAPMYNDVRHELLKRGLPTEDLSPKPRSHSNNNSMGFLPGTAQEKFKAASAPQPPVVQEPTKEPTQEETTAAVMASIQEGLEKDVTVKPIRLRMKSVKQPTA